MYSNTVTGKYSSELMNIYIFYLILIELRLSIDAYKTNGIPYNLFQCKVIHQAVILEIIQYSADVSVLYFIYHIAYLLYSV